MIARSGADPVRLYTLFMGPPENDAEWNDRGVEGAWRFLNRVWRLVTQLATNSTGQSSDKLKRKTHQTIKKVTEDLEQGFHFNTAISAIMELVNEIYKALDEKRDAPAVKEAVETVVILLSPFVPHIAEEMWQRLGEKKSVFAVSWPSYEREVLQAEEALIVVQINGRVRAKITVPHNMEEEELKKIVLEDKKVAACMAKKRPKKILVVPNKLVSIVI